MKSLLFAALAVYFAHQTAGHGRLMDPINRSSVWRINTSYPSNYLDNELFCGGFDVQYLENGGNCGVCGDNFASLKPHENQNTGYYGKGYIAKTYEQGSVITVGAEITANHIGYFQYSLCVLDTPDQLEEESCFQTLSYTDYSDKYFIGEQYGMIYSKLVLPPGVTCARCVLRWHYQTGNRWGVCTNGGQNMGCGQQEVFRSCSDISIV